MTWIVYPRAGTSVLDGMWMCSLLYGGQQSVEILELRYGSWMRGNSSLRNGEIVTHVDFVPTPAILTTEQLMKRRFG